MITKICLIFLIILAEFALGCGVYAAIQLFNVANKFEKEEKYFFKIFSILVGIFFIFVIIILPFIIF